MAKQISLLIIFCNFIFLPLLCGNSPIYSYIDDKEEDIELHGSLSGNPILRSSSTPIQVIKSPLFVNVLFLSPNGNLNVRVADETGMSVFQKNINTTNQTQLLIDISDWLHGSYTITFTNASGGCMYGNFEM